MSKKYYTQLDSLRGYAVLGVLLSHWIHIPIVMNSAAGNFGVNMFFVISGFLITEILYNDMDAGKTNGYILKKFYWRRALRIFPIYYLVCFATYFANFDDARELFWYNISYTTNFYNFFTGDGVSGSFFHIWSLCVEEQFYLIWPAIVLFTRNKKFNTILITIGIAIGLRALVWAVNMDHGHMFSYRMTPSCFDAFGLGALLAYTKKYKPDWLRKMLSYKFVPVVAAIVYLLYCYRFSSLDFFGDVLYRLDVAIISFYLIGYAVFEVKKEYFLLNIPLIRHIGIVSYGVYLYHVFIAHMLEDKVTELLHSISFIESSVLKYNLYLIKFPLYVAITVLLATISYKLFESKILKYKTKFS